MSWRPEGWVNPWAEGGYGERTVYEAGADAILEALRAMGTKTYSSHIDSDMEGGEGMILTSGRTVFIPDEE